LQAEQNEGFTVEQLIQPGSQAAGMLTVVLIETSTYPFVMYSCEHKVAEVQL